MTTRKTPKAKRIREQLPYIMVRFPGEREKAAVERDAKRAGYDHAATYLRDLATGAVAHGGKKK